jgi:pimeloyl-ACP methyl ester carboxylesterase
MFDLSLGDRLAGVGGVECLVVWGDEDVVCPRGEVDAFAAVLPKVQVEVLAGVGHRPEIEDPDGFVGVVSSFLAR